MIGFTPISHFIAFRLWKPLWLPAVWIAVFFALTTTSSAQVISTVAGTGTQGFSGDGGAATLAQLGLSTGNGTGSIFIDGSGNLYISDWSNHRIRKVDTSGNISTVAGTGTAGFSGDGGQVTNAQIDSPRGILVDPFGSGRFYISDAANFRIRRRNNSGQMSTIVGTGVNSATGDGGAAGSATISAIRGLAFDVLGDLYIADVNNHRIRKVDLTHNAGNVTIGNISTVVGTGTQSYSGDGGAATLATMNNPQDVFVDSLSNIYIADRNNDVIRKVDSSGTITTFAGNNTGGYSGDGGAATSANLLDPYGVYVDGSGNVFIADRGNHVIRKVDPFGTITTVAGDNASGGSYAGDGGAATSASLNSPDDVYLDLAGNLYIQDRSNFRIRKVTHPLSESTATAGLSGASTVSGGSEVQLLSAGITGDGSASVISVGVKISDLSSATGLAVSDFTELRLYRSTNATLDGGDTQIGTQTVVNVGDTTTVLATSANVPPNGSEAFYIVSAVISSNATAGHAFRVGFTNGAINTSFSGMGTEVVPNDANKVTISNIAETTTAAGLSGAATVLPGGETKIFSIGMTGDGTANLNSVTITLSDSSSATGLATSDFTELRLYRSTDAALDGSDTRIGTQTSVNVGSTTTITDTSSFVPANGTEVFFLVSAVMSASAVGSHTLKVGFAAGGVSTTTGTKGTVVTANDANRVTVSVSETATAAGLSGNTTSSAGSEVQLFSVGVRGDGAATVNSVALTLSDLSSATGVAVGDFTELRLYRNASATLSGATQIGSQSTVNIGSATTVSATSADKPSNGATTYYLISAVLSASAGKTHAFKVGFASGGVTTSVGTLGTAVSASDANKVTISNIDETATAAGLSGVSTILPGAETQIFSIGMTGDGIAGVSSVTVTVSDSSTSSGLATSDFGSLKLYKSADATLDGGDSLMVTQNTVNVGSGTTLSPGATHIPPSGSQVYYLVSATLSSSAVSGHVFRLGFASGGVSATTGTKGTAVTASDANRVRVAGLIESVIATGLSGSSSVLVGSETKVFGIGLTGDGVAGVNSVTLTLSDLSSATGLASSDIGSLKLYSSSDATLDSGDTLLGTQSTVNVGSATTITASATNIPSSGSLVYYLVSATLSSSAIDGHAFKVGFASGGVSTNASSIGSAVTVSDANKVTIAGVSTSASTVGLSGASTLLPGSEVQVFRYVFTGNGVTGVNSVALTLSDLSSATSLSSSDISSLKLYSSSDATLDSGDTLLGTQNTVNVGSVTTVSASSTHVPSSGTTQYYLVSATLGSSAVGGHAFKVGFATGGVSTNAGATGSAVSADDANKVTVAKLTESVTAAGLSGVSIVLPGSETKVFGIGLTGDGLAGINSVTVTVSDSSTSSGLASSDISSLKLYSSSDATLDSGDTLLGTQSTVNVGGATTITASSTNIPSSGSQVYYLVSATLSSSAVSGHVFRLGFAANGIATNANSVGSVVTASDANRVRVAGLVESAAATGLSGSSSVLVGSETKVFGIGLTGDGVAGVNSVTLTLSDLSSATGLASSDIGSLKLYSSSDATLDSGDTLLGTQSTVNVGSATTITASATNIPSAGSQVYYLVSATLSSSATDGHAFNVGFATGGVATNASSVGSAVSASDANKVTIAGVSSSGTTAGLSGSSVLLPGSEVKVFRYVFTGNGVTGVNSIALTLSDLSSATSLSSSDISSLKLYSSSDATLDSGDTLLGTQNTVNVGSATTVSASSTHVPSSGTTQYYLVSATLSSSAVGGHAFKVGFATGGVSTNAGATGSAVSADDANKVTVAKLTESVTAAGLSGASIVLPGKETKVFGIGLTGDGVAGVNSVTVTVSDSSTSSGLASSDISSLKLYSSSDATLDSGDTLLGTQSTVNVGGATTITASSTNIPSSGSQVYYLVSATLSSSAVSGHVFRLGFAANGIATNANSVGSVVIASDANHVRVAGVTESVSSTGLSGASSVLVGSETKIFSVGLTGDGVAGVNSVTLTLSDLSSATSLVSSDFDSLKLYSSTDATLDSGDTLLGTQSTVNVGSATTITASSTNIPSAGSLVYYLVSATLSSSATDGHAFKVGFATGGVATNASSVGSVVSVSDANKVTIAGVSTSASTVGLSGASTLLPGSEVQVFRYVFTGNGVTGVNSVALTLSDLASATGLASSDISSLKLYSSLDATLDNGDTLLGTQSTVNVGSVTTVSASSTHVPSSGTTQYYLVSATLSSSAVGGHAFKVGFASGGVSTNAGTAGSDVSASDANKVTVAQLVESTVATGLSGASSVMPGSEVKVFGIGLTGDGVAGVNSVALTLSDLSSATGLASSDFTQMKLYRSADAALDSGDTLIGSQSTVNVGSVTTVSSTSTDVPSAGATEYYLVSVVLSATAVGDHGFKVGFASGGVQTNAGTRGSPVSASDDNKVTVIGITETTAAAGLSAGAFFVPGKAIQIFSVGLTGNGVAGVNSVALTLSDLSAATGFVASDVAELRLFRSSDAILSTDDTQIGTQTVVNVGSATIVSAMTVDVIAANTQQFYLVSAVLSTTAGGNHGFKVGFAAGGVSTAIGGRGSAVIASDALAVNVLAPPVLATLKGLSGNNNKPKLDWADVSGATSYILTWADNADFKDEIGVTLTKSEYKFAEKLDDGRYFWRVRAVTSEGQTLFSSVDQFVISSERADPQGVSVRVLAPEPGQFAGIGDTVWVQVQAFRTMSALDTVIVGLSSSTNLEDFGNIGLIDTMTAKTSVDGPLDTFRMPLVITAGIEETNSSGVVVQARVSVRDDGVPLKALDNQSVLRLIANAGRNDDPGQPVVGDGVRFGVDGLRPINSRFFKQAIIDTAALANLGGSVFGTRATSDGAANSQQLIRSFKTGDEVKLHIQAENVGLDATSAVLHLVDAMTTGYQKPDRALYSVEVPFYDLLMNNGDFKISFVAKEGQFQHALAKNNMRVKVQGVLVDRAGNIGANTANAINSEPFEQDVWVVADTHTPIANVIHPAKSGQRFTGRIDTTMVYRKDDGVLDQSAHFELKPLIFSVSEGVMGRWAVVGGDSARYGGTHDTTAVKVATIDSFVVANSEVAGQNIDLNVVVKDSVGNVGMATVSDVVLDVVAPTISGLFPVSEQLPKSQISPNTVNPVFQVNEDVDSVSVRYFQVGGSHLVTAQPSNLSMVNGEISVTVSDSLIDEARYTLQVFVRDLAGNVQVSKLDTLEFESEFSNPEADSFVVVLDSVLTVVDSVIAGVNLPLKVTALNKQLASNGGLGTAILYEKAGVVIRVEAEGQDVSGVSFGGMGVHDLGNGVALLDGEGWLVGSRGVQVRSTHVLDDFAVVVEDTTWVADGVQVNFGGRLGGLTVDAGAFSRYSVAALENGKEVNTVSGAFDIWVQPTDLYGNPSVKLVQGKMNLSSTDSLILSRNLLRTRVLEGNLLESIWVMFSANKGDAQLPQGPQKIIGGGRMFRGIAPNRTGDGLVIGVHLSNAKGDTVGVASGQSRALGFEPVDVVEDPEIVIASVAPANLIAQDYLGPDQKGDQGRYVMLSFGHTAKQEQVERYRVYREILVASVLNEEGLVVALDKPELRFVPWQMIEPPQGVLPQIVRAVVPALDNDEARWAVAGEWGNEITEKVISEPVRAVDNVPPEGVTEIVAVVSDDESEVRLNWQVSADDRAVGSVIYRDYTTPIPGVERYEIMRGDRVKNLVSIAVLPAGSTEFVEAFVPGSVYRIDVLDLDNRTEGEPFSEDRIGPTVVLGGGTVRAGSSIDLDITVGRVRGIAGGSVKVTYDPSALRAEAVVVSDLIAGMVVLPVVDVPGEVSITFAGAEGLALNEGTLATIEFIALPAAEGVFDVTLDDVQLRDTAGDVLVLSERVSGQVSILSDKVNVQVADVSVDAGGRVVAPVLVSNGLGVAGGEWTLVYDASVMTAVQVDAGSLVTESEMLVVELTDIPGRVVVTVAGAQGFGTDAGEMARVVFDVHDGVADGAYGLALEDVGFRNATGESMAVGVVASGEIIVPEGGPGVQVRVEDATMVVGEKGAGVSVLVNRALNVAGGELTLQYDPSVLTATSVEVGELAILNGMLVLGSVDEPGEVRVTVVGASGLSLAEGELVVVRFDVADQAVAGVYDMDVMNAAFRDAEGGMLAQGKVTHGTVTIPEKGSGIGMRVVGATASPGTSVEIDIAVDRAEGLAGGEATLVYDPAVLSVKQVRAGPIANGFLVLNQEDVVGEVKLVFAGAGGIAVGAGGLAVVVFDVASDAPDGVYDLQLAETVFRDVSGQTVLVSDRQGGQVTVAATSDFNGDGNLTVSDLNLFAQHLGAQQSDAHYDRRFDMNRDGYVSFQDFLAFVEDFLAARQKVSKSDDFGQVTPDGDAEENEPLVDPE